MEFIVKDIKKGFIKSGEKSSNVDKGKLVIDGDKLVYKNGKEVEIELERVEKEKTINLLYARLETESGLVIQINMYEPKRKKTKKKKTNSLI